MSEYIERQKALDTVFRSHSVEAAHKFLAAIKPADVRPVVRGKWEMNSNYPDRLICSECGAQFDCWHWEAKQMHFCPNCGADMREVD